MFAGWDNFYLLVGSAGAALIGLLFVVASLTGGLQRSSALVGASLFMTPTVFHFGMVLVVSALALSPGVDPQAQGVTLAAGAAAGLLYSGWVTTHLALGHAPQPAHWSDVWCYGVAAVVAYLGLAASAALIWSAPGPAPYAIAVAVLALLVLAIRNAWDLVTWLAPKRED